MTSLHLEILFIVSEILSTSSRFWSFWTYRKAGRIFPLPIVRGEVSSSLLSSRPSHRSSSAVRQTSHLFMYESHGGGSPELSSAGEAQTTRKLVPRRNAERLLPVPLRSQRYLTKSVGWTKESDSILVFLAIKPDKQERSNQQPVYETSKAGSLTLATLPLGLVFVPMLPNLQDDCNISLYLFETIVFVFHEWIQTHNSSPITPNCRFQPPPCL